MPDDAVPESQPPVPLNRNRDFMALWTGQLASTLGSSLSSIAFSLVTLAVTHSASTAGLVAGADALGSLVAGPFTGTLTDRLSRRHLIAWGNLAGAVLFALLAVAGFTHHLAAWNLLLVSLLAGVVGALTRPALNASVRTVVPASQRAEASAYANVRANAASLIAPPVGGALVALGNGVPFLADTLSYLVAATSPVLVKNPLAAPQRKHRGFLRETTEGFTFLGRRRSLVGFCV